MIKSCFKCNMQAVVKSSHNYFLASFTVTVQLIAVYRGITTITANNCVVLVYQLCFFRMWDVLACLLSSCNICRYH